MRVRFTPSGERQFEAALAYLVSERPRAARRFYTRVATALKRLQRFPESGRRVPEFPELPYREIVIQPYRIFYQVGKDTVWVVGVWHGARRPGEPHGPEGG